MNNSEKELMDEFVRIVRAAGEDENAKIEEALKGAGAPEGDAGADNPFEKKEDPEDVGAIPPIDEPPMETPEEEAFKELIPWDKFVIIFDPHYAKKMEEENQLSKIKAKAKSYYLYYPDENQRIEGIVNKRYVGGYDTKENLGEDLEFLKTLSDAGFPPDWSDKILKDIDVAPTVEDEEIKEEVKPDEQDIEEKKEEPLEVEEKEEAPKKPEEALKPKAPEPNIPEPVGEVNTNDLKAARLAEKAMRRFSRLAHLRKI
jgi:hypothetical protein